MSEACRFFPSVLFPITLISFAATLFVFAPWVLLKTKPTLQFSQVGLGKLPVYYINLDRSKDRRSYVEQAFKSAESLTRIPAIDSMRGDFATHFNRGPFEDDVARDFWCKSQGGTCGEVGLSLSHYNALLTAMEDNASVALIVEDDASTMLMPFWTKSLDTVVDQADQSHPGWKIIRLQYTLHRHYDLFREFWKLHPEGSFKEHGLHLYGSVAYIINRSGMEDTVRQMTQVTTDSFDCNMRKVLVDPLIIQQPSGVLKCKSDWWLFTNFRPEEVLLHVPPLFTVRMYEGDTGIRGARKDTSQRFHEQSMVDSLRLTIENYEYWTSAATSDSRDQLADGRESHWRVVYPSTSPSV